MHHKPDSFQDNSVKWMCPATRHGDAWGERRYSSYSFLTSALDGGEWSASRPGRALPGERTPGTHFTGGWVGLSVGLYTEVRGKILCPCRGPNPDRPVVQSVYNILTELPRLPSEYRHKVNIKVRLIKLFNAENKTFYGNLHVSGLQLRGYILGWKMERNKSDRRQNMKWIL
jgi:hypothetical protein